MPPDVAEGMAKGFFRYLTKPMDFELFLNTLKAAVAPGPRTPSGQKEAGSPQTTPTPAQEKQREEPAAAPERIDRQRLSTLRSLTPRDTFVDLVREACAEIERGTATFPQAGREQDLPGLARDLHSLRGVCLNIGASELGGLAGSLEDRARAGDREALTQSAGTFRTLGTETVADLSHYLDDMPPPAVSAA